MHLAQGSFLTLSEDKIQAFSEAIVKFTNNVKDPKASLNPLYGYADNKVRSQKTPLLTDF
jgi:hypothetical protein